jgi:hypothetical protein
LACNTDVLDIAGFTGAGLPRASRDILTMISGKTARAINKTSGRASFLLSCTLSTLPGLEHRLIVTSIGLELNGKQGLQALEALADLKVTHGPLGTLQVAVQPVRNLIFSLISFLYFKTLTKK